MSYVELKHLLADLALAAVRHPDQASRVAVAAVCAAQASAHAGGGTNSLPRRDCLSRAAVLAAPLGSRPGPQDIEDLERAGLLEGEDDVVCLAPRFAPYRDYAQRQLARLLEALAILRRTSGDDTVDSAIRILAVLFNAGLFFECHEWGEDLWRREAGEAREFYHGLVQVAAAFYHHEKGNVRGRCALITRGRGRLASYPATYRGMDLERFRGELAGWAEHFEGGPQPPAFPQLTFAPKAKGAPRG